MTEPTETSPPGPDPATEAVRADFIEKTGLIAQNEGMPRITGRVFALLLFDGTAVSFSAIAAQLQVSRGSISAAVRMLEDLGLIRRVGRAGQRQDFFEISAERPDGVSPLTGLIDNAQKRAERAQADIAASAKALPESAEGPRVRLQAYADFYGAISAGLRETRKRL